MPSEKKFKRACEILEYDYQIRKFRNYRFSKRSYAKILRVSSGRLTDILSGKYPVSESKAKQWLPSLVVSPEEKKLFVLLAKNENQNRADKRDKKKLTSSKMLDHEQFAVVSDWEYFAFMALVETSSFRSEAQWIAKKMRLSAQRVEQIVTHLRDHGYIAIDEDGKIANTHHSLSTLNDIPSQVLQKANHDRVLLGLERMSKVDVLLRDVTAISFPVDKEKISEAKKLIRKFKGEMLKLLKGKNSSEVYNLNIQLIPLTDLEIQ